MRRGTKHSRRPRDGEYMAWVKTLPCAAREFGPCQGLIEADHAGDRAAFRRAPDDTCIPLCGEHHRQRTEYRGPWGRMSRDERRAWRHRAIERTREQWERWQGACF